MRTVDGASLVLVAFLTILPGSPMEAQIGGLIKKKAAEVAKGKADPKENGSKAPTDTCGPITPQKLQDFLRGLQAEGSAIKEFDSMVAKAESSRAESEPRIKACRDAENGGANYQKMMLEGFSGANPPSTAAAVQEQMAKNKAKWEEFLDKKCGKETPPARYDRATAYQKAHAAGAKAAGLSQDCYDVLADRVIAFCKLSKKDQGTAAEKGIRVQRAGDWVFTADEAKALQARCNELMPALASAGNTLAR